MSWEGLTNLPGCIPASHPGIVPSNPGAPDQDVPKKDVCVGMRIVPFIMVLIPDLFFVI